jgi:hypothetical protein
MNTAFAHALTATNLSTVTILSGKSINRDIIYIPAFKKTTSSSSRSLLLIHWRWLHWWPLLIVAPLLRWIPLRRITIRLLGWIPSLWVRIPVTLVSHDIRVAA